MSLSDLFTKKVLLSKYRQLFVGMTIGLLIAVPSVIIMLSHNSTRSGLVTQKNNPEQQNLRQDSKSQATSLEPQQTSTTQQTSTQQSITNNQNTSSPTPVSVPTVTPIPEPTPIVKPAPATLPNCVYVSGPTVGQHCPASPPSSFSYSSKWPCRVNGYPVPCDPYESTTQIGGSTQGNGSAVCTFVSSSGIQHNILVVDYGAYSEVDCSTAHAM